MDWLARGNTTGGFIPETQTARVRTPSIRFSIRFSWFETLDQREENYFGDLAHIVLRQNELLFAATKTAAQRGKRRILPHPVMCASSSVKH